LIDGSAKKNIHLWTEEFELNEDAATIAENCCIYTGESAWI
jgi:hypothetical protein